MTLAKVRQAQERLRKATNNQKAASRNLRTEVERARANGFRLAEIGEVLGITRQGVYDLLKRG